MWCSSARLNRKVWPRLIRTNIAKVRVEKFLDFFLPRDDQRSIFVTLVIRTFTNVTNGRPMNYVAYYRVSTKKQGASGLGLDAQRDAVARFVKTGDQILAEVTEVESGRKARRGLAEAVAFASAHGATLLVAKLDRIGRDAAFVLALRDSGVRFVCVDMPEANSLTIGIMAVMAQHEAEMTAKRTAEALTARMTRVYAKAAADLNIEIPAEITAVARQAYRERHREALAAAGVIDNVLPKARKVSAERRAANARTNFAWTRAELVARALRAQGHTFREIADSLNESAFTTRNGRPFQAMTVKRLLDRPEGTREEAHQTMLRKLM